MEPGHETESYINTNNTKLAPEAIYSFCRKRGLKISHQNINSLLNKLDIVKFFLVGTHRNVHVYGISETNLGSKIRDEELEIDGYDLVRKDRDNVERRGVLCYIRSDIKYQTRELEINGLEAIWFEIFVVNSRSILLCFSNKLPDSSIHIDKNFTSKFQDMIETATYESKKTLLAGDLNCNYLIPNDHKEMKDIVRINGLKKYT